jgi:amino acid adenylation domain-containing protein
MGSAPDHGAPDHGAPDHGAPDHERGQLSCAQQRLWLAAQAEGGGSSYHLGWMVHLHGELDTAALRAALAEVVSRHEALRSWLLESGGRPELRVTAPGPVTLPVTEIAAADAAAAARQLVGRPFAAGAGPLWRAGLYRTGPDEHLLVLALHHLIADTPTAALLLRELAVAYRAWRDGQPPVLPPAVPHSAYRAAEREFLAGPQCAVRVARWAGQLAGLPPLELPGDGPRRPGTPRQGAAASRPIPAKAADRLRRLARAEGGSLAHVLLAAYAVVLHRASDSGDLAIGVPVSTRRGRRWADSAGLYVNTLPIRVRLAGNPPFDRLVRQVRDTMLAAIDAADVPLDRVAAAVAAGPRPLHEVTFGMTPGTVLTLDLPGVVSRVEPVYGGHAKLDLHLEVTDRGRGTELAVLLEYDTGRWRAATARRLLRSLTTLLTAATADPGQRIGVLPLWPGASERPAAELPALPGGGRVDVLLAATAAAAGPAPAVIDAATGARLSYAELTARAGAIAADLAARGIGRGHFVAVTLGRSVDLVVAIAGVLAAGAAYVPLDAGYPVARLTEMIALAGARLVIGPVPDGLGVPALDLAALGAGRSTPTQPPARPGSPADPAYVMFTSGSTGRPKAVVVPHRAIVRLVRDSGFARLASDERWLHAASPAFDGSTLELWAPLLNGGTLVVLAGPPTVAALGDAITRRGVTSAFLTTGLFNMVVDTDVGVLAPLRQLMIGGEAASAGHLRRALAVVPVVVNGYGPTENTTFTSCHVMRSARAVTSPVPIGRPIGGTVVHVMDAYLNPVPPGAVGEILAGGLGLADGYAGAPGLTAERFVPSPLGPPGARLYRTGDYGRVGPGGLLHFAGRKDDQVKVRGFRVELGAAEHALLCHPGVTQAAVAVHTDPTGDRRLIGYTVGPADGAGLTAFLRGTLPEYLIPGQWVRLDALPLGPTGKVDRHALPAPQAAAAQPERPLTAVEQLLAAWYCELLGLATAGPDTDFLAAGGHSLLAARLVNRIRVKLGVEVSLSAIFAIPSLADLAAMVTVRQQAGDPPGDQSGRPGDQPERQGAGEWTPTASSTR